MKIDGMKAARMIREIGGAGKVGVVAHEVDVRMRAITGKGKGKLNIARPYALTAVGQMTPSLPEGGVYITVAMNEDELRALREDIDDLLGIK